MQYEQAIDYRISGQRHCDVSPLGFCRAKTQLKVCSTNLATPDSAFYPTERQLLN